MMWPDHYLIERMKMKKLRNTIAMLYNMGMARTFGEYIYTLNGPNQPTVAVYRWRKRTWWIPTSHVED